MDERPIHYNDLYFRIIVALVAAHLIVVIGEDETFFQLIVMWDYYRSLLFSFAIAFLLVNVVYFITTRLDRKYDWQLYTFQRVSFQLILALFLPAIAAFLLAYFYFKAFGIAIEHTWYLRYDYPVVVGLLLMLNLYYLAFYFFRKWQQTEQASKREIQLQQATVKNVANTKEIFVVNKGAENIPLPVTLIAYFFRQGEYNFLRTFDKEDFMLQETLDELQAQLSEKEFFRINRQMIVSIRACERFSNAEYGKLELTLKPLVKEPVMISQKRAKAFKDWIAK